MIIKKALLAGLIGTSLCMANISGIVTDTSTTPIAGAVVKLENGGQTATTGADGRFTIVLGSTTVLPSNSTSLPHVMSAGISGNLMFITVTERSILEITKFDLNGKTLATLHKEMFVGTNSISLAQQGLGIYLYKVKSGNRDLMLKGNLAGKAPYGRSVPLQCSISKPLSKQVMKTSALNDVIDVIKAGFLNFRVVAYNSDTTGLVIKMMPSAGTVIDVDENVYQTVKIGNQVWMAENLRVTRYNDGALISLDTSSTIWANATSPKYCFFSTNSGNIKNYGALYNWYVVSPANLKKIAPAGWHVPNDAEWDTLQNYMIAKGYNWNGTTSGNKIGKSLAEKADWFIDNTTGAIGCDLTKNNSSGFSAHPGGNRAIDGSFYSMTNYGSYWSASEADAISAYSRYLYFNSDNLFRLNYNKSFGFSVRLVRD